MSTTVDTRRVVALAGAGLLAMSALAAPVVAQSPSTGAPLQIAYLSFAVANSYDAPMLEAATAAAAAGNATLTVSDANNDYNAQVRQLQDAVALGKYDGIVVQPIFGASLVPGVQAAIAAGIEVANIDQILGTDYTTAASQVDGLSSNVVFVPSDMGTKIGNLTVDACADIAADPCEVGFIWSVKNSGLDQQLRASFDAAIGAKPGISVVSDAGESYYQQTLGLKAAQDMLTAHPGIDVIVGADQAISGAIEAAKSAQLADKIRMVGYGGGQVALAGIQAGERFGTVMQLPATEGKLGVEQLIAAIRSGTPTAGMDPLAQLPDGGVVTKANVADFLTLAEWPG